MKMTNNDFIAFHEQYASIDIAFIVLFFSYVLYFIFISGDFFNIIHHKVNPKSSIQGNRYNIKQRIIVWANVNLILSSAIITSQIIRYNIEIVCLAVAICLATIVLIRHVSISCMGLLTGDTHFYKTLNYVNDCQIVILTYILSPLVLISYCIDKFYEISFVVIIAYCIYHILRVVKLLINNQFSLFDVILYLCTLEFLPIGVFASLYKLLTKFLTVI